MWGIPGLNVRWRSADESFSPRPDNKEDEEKKSTKGKKVGGGGGKVRNFISKLMVTIQRMETDSKENMIFRTFYIFILVFESDLHNLEKRFLNIQNLIILIKHGLLNYNAR